jgi:hypothetical protein
MKREPLDFVPVHLQPRRSLDAEQRLLPLAAERRMAVIVNRPFDGGTSLAPGRRGRCRAGRRRSTAASWAEAFLKFIVSHPAVTCAIPATSKVAHVRENLRAIQGRLPDEALRRRIAADIRKSVSRSARNELADGELETIAEPRDARRIPAKRAPRRCRSERTRVPASGNAMIPATIQDERRGGSSRCDSGRLALLRTSLVTLEKALARGGAAAASRHPWA